MASCGTNLTPLQRGEQRLLGRIDSIEFLHPDFADIIYDLTLVMRQHQMPFKVYETYRTPSRQKKLISLGLSKISDPMSNKHVHGLAVDFLLDYRAVRSLNKNRLSRITESDLGERKRTASDDFGGVFNIGVNAIETETDAARTVVEDKVVLDFWNYLGTLIERQFPDLVWGGSYKSSVGELIGSDPSHIEYRHADKLITQRRTIPILRSQGNPGLGGVI